jgi:hypothetical protein
MSNNNSIYLHIGFSKAASSWLQSYFKSFDDIYYLEKTGYFSLSGFNKQNEYNYIDLFEGAKRDQIKLESDEHIVLPNFHPVLKSHGTTLESVEKVIYKIKENIPEGKIILVLRNQYDLILSRYSQFLIGGGSLTFKNFINEMLNCSVDGENYYQNYYFQIIKLLYEIFGKDNVCVILQERLKEDINKLNTFLGVESNKLHEKSILNQRKGLSLLSLKILRIVNKAIVKRKATYNSKPKTFLPYLLYITLITRGIRIADYYILNYLSRSKKKLLNNNIRYQLSKIFTEDNSNLTTLLHKDLKSYGYY